MLSIKKNIWTNTIKTTPEKHKNLYLNELTKSLDNNDLLKKWWTAEYWNNKSELFYLFKAIKNIDESICIYQDFYNDMLKEITITSKEYKKDIFDKIVDLILKYKDNTDIELQYYYIAESEMKECQNLRKF